MRGRSWRGGRAPEDGWRLSTMQQERHPRRRDYSSLEADGGTGRLSAGKPAGRRGFRRGDKGESTEIRSGRRRRRKDGRPDDSFSLVSPRLGSPSGGRSWLILAYAVDARPLFAACCGPTDDVARRTKGRSSTAPPTPPAPARCLLHLELLPPRLPLDRHLADTSRPPCLSSGRPTSRPSPRCVPLVSLASPLRAS